MGTKTQNFMLIPHALKWSQKKIRKKVIGKKLSEFFSFFLDFALLILVEYHKVLKLKNPTVPYVSPLKMME